MKTIEIKDDADGVIRLTDVRPTTLDEEPLVLVSVPLTPCLLTRRTAIEVMKALERFIELGSIAYCERPNPSEAALSALALGAITSLIDKGASTAIVIVATGDSHRIEFSGPWLAMEGLAHRAAMLIGNRHVAEVLAKALAARGQGGA